MFDFILSDRCINYKTGLPCGSWSKRMLSGYREIHTLYSDVNFFWQCRTTVKLTIMLARRSKLVAQDNQRTEKCWPSIKNKAIISFVDSTWIIHANFAFKPLAHSQMNLFTGCEDPKCAKFKFFDLKYQSLHFFIGVVIECRMVNRKQERKIRSWI